MASTIQIRVDDDLKNKSDQLFKDLGTDTTSAIRMFLTQADRKSTRLNSSHRSLSRMPSSA